MDGINENNCEVENDNSEEEEEESVPNESKSDKFVRIAERRTNKILSDISLLGNLSNRINYKYSTEQTDQMFSAIETQLQEVKEKFYSKEKQDVLFKFK
jgi:hypothetical protein